jgi:hypothetical protein
MRKFALFLVILALFSGVGSVDLIPNIHPEAYWEAMSLLNEIYPHWKIDIISDPWAMPEIYEEILTVYAEAFLRKAAVQGTKIYNAIRSRFVGAGARLSRGRVVAAVAETFGGVQIEMVGETVAEVLVSDAGKDIAMCCASALKSFCFTISPKA